MDAAADAPEPPAKAPAFPSVGFPAEAAVAAAVGFPAEAAAFCASQIFSISGSSALKSMRANRAGAGVTETVCESPNLPHSSKLLSRPLNAARIFAEVADIKLSSREAPI